jgi:hypothetical protein
VAQVQAIKKLSSFISLFSFRNFQPGTTTTDHLGLLLLFLRNEKVKSVWFL